MKHINTERLGRRRLQALAGMRPRTEHQLRRFVYHALGMDVVRSKSSGGGPFGYVCHAFFERGDCVVWANRGGGKTVLGAVATLLDLVFKPGVQVRILAGSLEQAGKMYEHLVGLLDRPVLRGVVAGTPTQRKVALLNGSVAEILSASQRSVRGVRVHKLRVDEVEELSPELWEAAQLVTRSGDCGGVAVRGSVEALSTMHRPAGVMARLASGKYEGFGRELDAVEGEDAGYSTAAYGSGGLKLGGEVNSETSGGGGWAVFRWNAMDVVAKCEPERVCEGCVLWDDCGGRAKGASGFVPVADLVAQRGRISDGAWASEMMCHRPKAADGVYPQFEEGVHVREGGGHPTTVCGSGGLKFEEMVYVGGMDFGLRSPTVVLWAGVYGETLHVLGEYADSERTLPEHVRRVGALAGELGLPGLGELCWIGVDPAGRQRNAHSGRSDIALLREAGATVRSRASRIVDGIEMIRRRLDRQTLLIHPRCTGLIAAMGAYHFDRGDVNREAPVKDGPDHWCDALRYLVVNLERGGGAVEVRGW